MRLFSSLALVAAFALPVGAALSAFATPAPVQAQEREMFFSTQSHRALDVRVQTFPDAPTTLPNGDIKLFASSEELSRDNLFPLTLPAEVLAELYQNGTLNGDVPLSVALSNKVLNINTKGGEITSVNSVIPASMQGVYFQLSYAYQAQAIRVAVKPESYRGHVVFEAFLEPWGNHSFEIALPPELEGELIANGTLDPLSFPPFFNGKHYADMTVDIMRGRITAIHSVAVVH